MFLTAEEVEELTQRHRRPAQSRALTKMGITHLVRPDGSVAVSRAHVEQKLNDKAPPAARKKEPTWGAAKGFRHA